MKKVISAFDYYSGIVLPIQNIFAITVKCKCTLGNDKKTYFFLDAGSCYTLHKTGYCIISYKMRTTLEVFSYSEIWSLTGLRYLLLFFKNKIPLNLPQSLHFQQSILHINVFSNWSTAYKLWKEKLLQNFILVRERDRTVNQWRQYQHTVRFKKVIIFHCLRICNRWTQRQRVAESHQMSWNTKVPC